VTIALVSDPQARVPRSRAVLVVSLLVAVAVTSVVLMRQRTARDGSSAPDVRPASAATTHSAAVATPAAAPPVEDVPLTSLAGMVVSATTRAPVEGATVKASDRLKSWTAITNAKGWFNIAAPAGSYRLVARKDTLVGAFASTVAHGPDAVPVDIVITVAEGHGVAGHVRDSHGSAVAGAELHAQRDEANLLSDDGSTVSANDGSYRIGGLLPTRYTVKVSARGYATAHTDVELENAADAVDFTLTDGASLRGIVRMASGEAVPGAVISIRASLNNPWQVLSSAVADDAGHYELVDLASGKLFVKASASQRGLTTVPTTLMAGERRQLDLTLSEGATVAGIVVDENDRPMEGAHLIAGLNRTDATTGSDGKFKLVGFDAGHDVIVANAPGVTDRARATNTLVQLSENQHLEGLKIVVIGEGRQLRGRVLAPDGSAGWGARVLYVASSGGSVIPRNTTADADGNFELKGLAAGKGSLTAQKEGFASGQIDAVASDASGVIVKLRSAASVSGVVVDGHDQPVTAYRIEAVRTKDPSDEALAYQHESASVRDPGGAFHIGDLHAGHFRLSVRATNGSVGVLDNIKLADGEDKAGVKVVVGAGATVTGHVVDNATEKPMSGVRVTAGGVSAMSDEQGAFSVGGVIPGNVSVGVYARDYVADSVEVQVAAGASADVGAVRLLHGQVPDYPVAYDGIGVGRSDGAAIAETVQRDSPADRAGITAGDALLAVNGTDVHRLGAGAIEFLLSGKAGDTVRVTFSRAGTAPRTVELQLAPVK
jgi:hypothetical protein